MLTNLPSWNYILFISPTSIRTKLVLLCLCLFVFRQVDDKILIKAYFGDSVMPSEYFRDVEL